MNPPEIPTLPAPASRHALALLRFPDRRTDWVIVSAATLREPTTAEAIEAKMAKLNKSVPSIGARLQGEMWHAGEPAPVRVIEDEPLERDDLDYAFDLANEPALRLTLGVNGTRLAFVCHHAAFDGLGLAAIVDYLTGGDVPHAVESPPPGPPGSKLPLIKRLLRPAPRIAPTVGVWPTDAYATATPNLAGKGVTARLTEACVAAARAHNLRHGERLDRVGITIAVGGPVGVGNVASYRRLDLKATGPIGPAVNAALADPTEPQEQVNAPPLLMRAVQPLIERFSDTILVSNIGRLDIPGISRFDVFAVARGRSAVAFCCTSVVGGETSLTLRSRDLSPSENRRLLDEVVERT